MSQFLQPSPAAGDKPFLLADINAVELTLVERAFNRDPFKIWIDNELGQRWITANMPLPRRMERLRIDLTNHIPQVQVALKNMLDVATANVTQIASFAAGHGRK